MTQRSPTNSRRRRVVEATEAINVSPHLTDHNNAQLILFPRGFVGMKPAFSNAMVRLQWRTRWQALAVLLPIRLIFRFFAEDIEIFSKPLLFKSTIEQMSARYSLPLLNRSHATSNRVSGGTAPRIESADQRRACEISWAGQRTPIGALQRPRSAALTCGTVAHIFATGARP